MKTNSPSLSFLSRGPGDRDLFDVQILWQKNKFTSYTFQDNHQEERIPDHAGRTVHVGGVAQNTGHSLWRPEVNEAAVLI